MQQVYLNLSRSDKKCELPGIKCVYVFSFSVYVIKFFTCMFLMFELFVIKIFSCMIFSFCEKNVCYLGSCMFLRYFVYDDQFLLACYYN